MYFNTLCAALLISLGIATPTINSNSICDDPDNCFLDSVDDVLTPPSNPVPNGLDLISQAKLIGKYVIDHVCFEDPDKCRICRQTRQTICEEADVSSDKLSLCSKKRDPNNPLCAYFTGFGLPPHTFGVIPRRNLELKGYCPWAFGTCAICADVVNHPQCWPAALQRDRDGNPTIVCTTKKPKEQCLEVTIDTIWHVD